MVVLEQLLRLGVGQLKPLEIAEPLLDAIGSGLVWSLWMNPKHDAKSQSIASMAKKKKQKQN